MTVVNSNVYTNIYTSTAQQAQSTSTSQSNTTTNTSTRDDTDTVSLSAAAQEILNGRTFATVIADAHTHLADVLADTGRTSLLKDGKLDVDLSSFDRRELFAISSNADNTFSVDEQKAASLELQRRFDEALAGPTAVVRVTGDVTKLYTAALEHLESMSEEEQATTDWQNKKAAVENALSRLEADPNTVPADIANDPVTDYLDRIDTGDAEAVRDFADVTNDARATLDQQYKNSDALRPGNEVDFSDFSGRSLASVALNNNDLFNDQEVRVAKEEIRTRSGNAIRAAYESSRSSNEPTALAQNIIAQYGSMSDEERQAAGWTEDFYNTVVSNYETSKRLSEMMGSSSASSGYMSLLNYI